MAAALAFINPKVSQSTVEPFMTPIRSLLVNPPHREATLKLMEL